MGEVFGMNMVRLSTRGCNFPENLYDQRRSLNRRVSTAVLLVLVSLIFSSLVMDAVARVVGPASLVPHSGPELCAETKRKEFLEKLKEEFDTRTNIAQARAQHGNMSKFAKALTADVELYGKRDGESPLFECPGKSKSSWDTQYPSRGEYFPGACKEALAQAIVDAKSQLCEKQKRECVFKKLGICFKKNSIPYPYACPGDTSRLEAQEANLRQIQTEVALSEDREISLTTYEAEGADAVQKAAEDFGDTLLLQIDVASWCYVAYTILSLFFVTPLVIYRAPLEWRVKRNIFSLNKELFIFLFVTLWWGYSDFTIMVKQPQVQLYLANLGADPCWLDVTFLRDRREIITGKCIELKALQKNYTDMHIRAEN